MTPSTRTARTGRPRVVVVGSGGREHALALVLGRSADVVVTPGNPGIPGSTPADPTELEADLFVVGPEAPLVDGLADRLRGRGARVFGPGADGARLEGSKAWMKRVLADAGVPTARHGAFEDEADAVAFLRSLPGPWVIKTDGLAAGKGVLVTDSRAEAERDVGAKLSGAAFGPAGRTVVIEEFLDGPEISLLALCDGRRAVPLAPAQDFKRIADGDQGPNTGGMGAYSPVPFAGDAVVDDVMDRFVEPTLFRLRKLGIDYRGTLYAGLVLTAEGPKLLEYNVRFGDPEAQVVLPRLADDVTDLLGRAADGDLRADPHWLPAAAVCVVAAAPGYPEAPRTGAPIEHDAERAAELGVDICWAGVGSGDDGRLVTAGGRVAGVVGHGATLGEARARAYDGIATVTFPDMQYRRDIAAELEEAPTP